MLVFNSLNLVAFRQMAMIKSPQPIGGSRLGLLRYKAHVHVISVFFLALLVASCTSSPPAGTGDPGNVRLHALANQSIFHVLPPDATFAKPTKFYPATWDSIYGGWSDVALNVYITSKQSMGSVYAFYADYAAAHGWKVVNRGLFNLVQTWKKTLPDGVVAYLGLDVNWTSFPTSPNQVEPSYTLNGDMSAKLQA